jgi:cellulose biosynthesis protein BcsQ
MGSLSLILAFLHAKAGQGKTTLAVEIAAVLAYLYGIRTLFIDLDTRGHATKWIAGVDERGVANFYNIAHDRSSTQLFLDAKRANPKHVICQFPQVPNLAVIPANPGLKIIEKIPEQWPMLLPRPLEFLQAHCQDFQAAVVDIPGGLELMAQVGATTANVIGTPCKPEPLCTEDLPAVKSFLKTMQMSHKWKGVIPSIIRHHIGAHKRGLEEMVNMFRDDPEFGASHVFSQHFPDRSKLIDGLALGVPYCVTAPTSEETQIVVAILEELMRRAGQTLPPPLPLGRVNRKIVVIHDEQV